MTQAQKRGALLLAGLGLAAGIALAIGYWPPRGEERASWRGHAGPVWALAISSDGAALASAGEDGWVRVWNLAGQLLAERPISLKALRCLAMSSGLLAAGGDDKKLYLLDGLTLSQKAALAGHADSLTCVAFAPDGKSITSGSRDKSMRVWSPEASDAVMVIKTKARLSAVAAAPDGQWLASGGDDGALSLWNKGSEPAATLPGHKSRVCNIVFSQDGKRLVSGGRGGDIRLWDLNIAGEADLLKGHVGRVDALAFSAGRALLISGGEDRMLRFWRIEGDRKPILRKGHAGSITSIAVAPDGTSLASADTDGRILIWDIPQ